jgi:septal ring factor EnvC (AmiA/AmiB activator)
LNKRPAYQHTPMPPSRLTLLATLTAFALAAGALPARAEDAADPSSALSTVEQQLRSSKDEQDRIARDIAAAEDEQEQISQRLVEISQKIQAQEAAITASEERVLKLNQEEVVILSDLAAKQDVLSELLAGLQRLEQNPPPALVVEPHDVLAALRGAMMFGTIVPELRAEAEELTRKLARLDEVRNQAKSQEQTLREEIARLTTARTDLDGLIGKKRDLVKSANIRLDAEKKRATDLGAKAQSMKQLLASLADERRRQQEEDAKKAAAEELRKKRLRDALQQPKLAFGDARGRLAYPAQGQILKRFGDDDGLGGSLRGVALATRDGAQVTAPADGHVEFAGPFRSYGQVLILNVGGGYHVLLAGLGQVTAGTGEFLRAGEPVGQMGSGPSSVTLLGDVMQDKRPVLYIEFRNSSDAIDSSPWWIGGTQEARG